ncbi:hypothetical protein FB45DRAFT_1052279 [Roridomyces roridus]|uniref:Uncharacterized protein n=1 Tax=Roridomyces roridus TaxID=1738132 RepID=A0AAD7FXC5_9AGAR|nr:hypothetical protein FB45DRAFT_1052279 [Roridomyces roridus]
MWALFLRPSVVRSHRGVRLHLIPTDASRVQKSRRLSTETGDNPQLPVDEIAARSPQQEALPKDVKPRQSHGSLHPFGKKGAAMDAKVERIENSALADREEEDDWDVTPKLAQEEGPPLLKFRVQVTCAPMPKQPKPESPPPPPPAPPLPIQPKTMQVQSAEPAPSAPTPVPSPKQPEPEPKSKMSSVGLWHLPPFTTLSDLSRIALRSGARPAEVLGLQLVVQSTTLKDRRDHGENYNFTLGAFIHFSDPALVRAFRAKPLLLTLHNVPSSPHPEIGIFPTTAEAEAWPLRRLHQLVTALQKRSDERIQAVLQQTDVEAEADAPAALKRRIRIQSEVEEHVEPLEETAKVEQHSKKEQEVLEREGALKLMWSRLEDPDGSQQLAVEDAETKDIDGDQQPHAEELLIPENTESTATSEHPKIVHAIITRIRHHRYTLDLVDQMVKSGAGRWLALRLPGSGLSVDSPTSRTNTGAYASTSSSLEDVEDDEHTDPAVRLYALSLRKALARERELEDVLMNTRTEAMERAVRDAKLAAEAQLRSDFGAFGAIEGVWLRGKPVRRFSDDDWVYELHALIGFADTENAMRARTLLPVHIPAYADTQIRFVADPWPEAIGGEVPAALEVDGSEMEVMSAAREGWARRMQREHDQEERLRKREQERERQRGVAEGTWGKEQLHEIRERLNLTRPPRKEKDAAALGRLQHNTLETIGLVTKVLAKQEKRKKAEQVAKEVMTRVKAKAFRRTTAKAATKPDSTPSEVETGLESNPGSSEVHSDDDKKTPSASVQMPYVAHF